MCFVNVIAQSLCRATGLLELFSSPSCFEVIHSKLPNDSVCKCLIRLAQAYVHVDSNVSSLSPLSVSQCQSSVGSKFPVRSDLVTDPPRHRNHRHAPRKNGPLPRQSPQQKHRHQQSLRQSHVTQVICVQLSLDATLIFVVTSMFVAPVFLFFSLRPSALFLVRTLTNSSPHAST